MKILLITDGLPPDVLGGAGQIVLTTAQELVKRGHHVSILTTSKDGNAPAIPGIDVHAIPRRTSRWAHYRSVFSSERASEITRVIDAVKPDLIHAHSIAWQAGYRWILFARKRGIPVFFTAHDVMVVAYGRVMGDEKFLFLRDIKRARWTWNPLRNILIRSTLNTHCHVLCVSDALRNYLTSFGFRNLTTLHNGIDLAFWKPVLTQDQAREELKIPKDKTVFLLAGRLGIDKGTDIVARTLPKDAHLLLAGDVDTAEFAALGDRAHFLGRRTSEQMKTVYAACDVTLVPSVCLDCFPTMNLEAMASERPVLATSFGGSREAVDDGVTGWILDPRNEQELHHKMTWCVAHRDALPNIGNKGCQRAKEVFSMEHHVTTLEALYTNVTASEQ